MADLLPASLAALGAVIGFIVGATAIPLLMWPLLGFEFEIPVTVFGALTGAIALSWLGLRLSRRLARKPVEPG